MSAGVESHYGFGVVVFASEGSNRCVALGDTGRRASRHRGAHAKRDRLAIYLLEFSDRTFGDFFAEEFDIEINDQRYFAEGSSRANSLRYFLKTTDVATRVRVLQALWEYRTALYRRKRAGDPIKNAESQFTVLIQRVGGRRQRRARPDRPARSHRCPAQGRFLSCMRNG